MPQGQDKSTDISHLPAFDASALPAYPKSYSSPADAVAHGASPDEIQAATHAPAPGPLDKALLLDRPQPMGTIVPGQVLPAAFPVEHPKAAAEAFGTGLAAGTAITNPVALAKSVLGAAGGSWLGRELGRPWGAEETGGKVGSVVGGFAGPFLNPETLLSRPNLIRSLISDTPGVVKYSPGEAAQAESEAAKVFRNVAEKAAMGHELTPAEEKLLEANVQRNYTPESGMDTAASKAGKVYASRGSSFRPTNSQLEYNLPKPEKPISLGKAPAELPAKNWSSRSGQSGHIRIGSEPESPSPLGNNGKVTREGIQHAIDELPPETPAEAKARRYQSAVIRHEQKFNGMRIPEPEDLDFRKNKGPR